MSVPKFFAETPDFGTLVLSGVVNGLLMFVFCCVFSILIFQDVGDGDTLKNFLPIGVSMHTFAVMAGAFSFSMFSGSRASIAGPSINPALFLSLIVQEIQIGPDPSNPTPENKILPTCLFAIFTSSLLVSITFYTLGRLRLTRIVQYLPASLLNGFLACIGYKVMKAALTTTCGMEYYDKPSTYMFWKLLLPALPLGLGLYISKAYHIGKPAVSISVFLLVPLVLFYVCLGVSGVSMAEARQSCADIQSSGSCHGGWFFPEFTSAKFYDVYQELKVEDIDMGALTSALPELPPMIAVIVIELLLELAGIKKATGVEFAFDNEMKTAGLACFLSGVVGLSVPAYSQTKFTLLNLGIAHNLKSRIPSVVCGLFNGLLFFWGFPLINYLPRFFLGGLLIYAGMGFIVDNLLVSRNRVSSEEYFAIWVILIVNVFVGLLIAIIVGVVLSAIIFALAYGRLGVIKAYIEGCDYESRVVRSVTESRKLIHLSQRYSIIQMQNFIFFGSAGQILDLAKSLVNEQQPMPKARRLAYVIFDWTNVYGIDYSGIGVFGDIVNLLKGEDIMVVFTGVEDNILKQLLRENILQKIAGVYDTLDFGVEWVEEQLLEWAHLVRSRWLEFRSVIKMHELAKNKAKHDALEEILSGIGFGHELWKYITRLGLKKGEILCTPGEPVRTMYIVQQGKFSAFFTDELGNVRKVCSYTRGAYINECALFTTADQLYKVVADIPNTIVLAITHSSLSKLTSEQPELLIGLQRTVLNFYRQSNMKLEREIGDLEHTKFRNNQYIEAQKKLSPASRTAKLTGVMSWMSRNAFKRSSIVVPDISGRRAGAMSLRRASIGSVSARDGSVRGENSIGSSTTNPSSGRNSFSSSTSSFRLGHGKGKSSGSLLKVQEAADPGICLLHAIVNLSKHEKKEKLSVLLGRSQTELWEERTGALELAHDKPDAVTLFHYRKAHREAGGGVSFKSLSRRTVSRKNLLEASGEDTFAGLLRLSREEEMDCRACFKTHDKAGLGYINSTKLGDVLEDVGHFISNKEITLLLRSKQTVGSSAQQENAIKSRKALSLLMQQSSETGFHSRRINPADISRESQLELISIFLSSTSFFPELENHFPGLIGTVAKETELLVYHRDETICFEGAPINSMIIVVDGDVVCSDGKESKVMNADQTTLVFGDNQIFLPVSATGQHIHTISVCSARAVVIEVFRTSLAQVLPKNDQKRKELQAKALFWKENRNFGTKKRKLLPVFAEQQKAPFGTRFRALSNIDLFKDVFTKDKYLLSRVASESEVVEFAMHDFIFHEGDSGDFVLVVLHGDVQVKSTTENYFIRFAKHKDGYTLGENALLYSKVERQQDIVVVSESLVALKFSRQSLSSIFEASHYIWGQLQEKSNSTSERKRGSVIVMDKLANIGSHIKSTLQNTKLSVESTETSVDEEGNDTAIYESSTVSLREESGAFSSVRTPSVTLPVNDPFTNLIGSTVDIIPKQLALDPNHIQNGHNDGIFEALRVTEDDFLNMVNRLTFYPLSQDQLEVIQQIFEDYKETRKPADDIEQPLTDEEEDTGIISESSLRKLFKDGKVKVSHEAVSNLISEWRSQDFRREPSLTFSAFVSIIASATKRALLVWQVESIFKTIITMDPRMEETINETVVTTNDTSEKWSELAKREVGIYPIHIQTAWAKLLDVDISLDACEEMIFEADHGCLGFLPYTYWIDTISSIHHCELESTEFERFESAVKEITEKAESETRAPIVAASFRVKNFTKRIGNRASFSSRRPKNNA